MFSKIYKFIHSEIYVLFTQFHYTRDKHRGAESDKIGWGGEGGKTLLKKI